MDPVRFRPEPPLVADASVWVNLVAGGRATDVLRALAASTIIPSIVLGELERGRDRGRSTYAAITPLIADGYITVMDLPEAAEGIYLSLVAGRASQTLDDGEAATLALALHLGTTALIDERKAIGVATARFPDLTVATTTDLLLSAQIRLMLDADTLATVLFASLTQARMRVPDHLLNEVCDCLGPERVRLCLSLPARVRTGLADAAEASEIRDSD
ncbi:hypothetical protein [Novosphingobium sp. Fuku2-ISO-50]|uniref:hypothetical protein n=1 Tax=Novosphingobium sp. Fuku2-ISO-50 TaxID=1739114 RepID=UPI00076C25AC|nr:hypothetical protein [Novosphingobium sp. Fuku2-ISO-50]KUR75330.1 hypothetical protein AQZ50_15845 [Novosphingobium sp. Fuku2-ISO-50]